MILTVSSHPRAKPVSGYVAESRHRPGQLYASTIATREIRNTGLLLLIFTILLMCSMQSMAATENIPRDAMEYFFNQSFNSLDEELEIAIEENKSGVFIMFSDKDCPWCLKMKTTILNRPEVQDYYRQHFRLLTIDIRGDTMMTDFEGNEIYEKDFAFKQHRVRATPVFIFFDTHGKKTMRFTGIVRDAKEFLWLGEFVVSGTYKTTNFTKYKRDRTQQEKSASLTQQQK